MRESCTSVTVPPTAFWRGAESRGTRARDDRSVTVRGRGGRISGLSQVSATRPVVVGLDALVWID
jgi:hypothetical protein